MRNGEIEVKAENYEETFCLFSVLMVEDNRIRVLLSVTWGLLNINFLFSNYKKPSDVLL